MADKRVLEEQQCNTATPRGARQLKRRRIVNSSPLSDTARRLLLQKCSDSGHGSHETAVSTMVVEPVSSPIALASTSDACISSLQTSSAPEILDMIGNKYPQLHIEKGTESDQWLVVSRKPVVTEKYGPMVNPRLCIVGPGENVSFKWQVFFHTLDEGKYCSDKINHYLEQLLPSSGYCVCPGIIDYPHETIRYNTKNLREWGIPFNRVDSKKCDLWHIPNNVHHPTGDNLRNTCQQCRFLHRDIQQLLKAANAVSEEQKLARSSVSSRYPLKYLSPATKAKRVSKVCRERVTLSAKLAKVEHFDFDVSEKQHSELLELVRSVHKKRSKDIEELCDEGEHVLGVDSPLREVWQQDVIERLEFEKDQTRNATSCRGNKWSAITVRMALAVFTRSPAAYDALKDFKLLQLPSRRTLKDYISANLDKAGECFEHLKEERKLYLSKIEEQKKTKQSGDLLPTGEGVLVIDEVKVGLRLVWSSRSQRFSGLCMTHHELASLCDIYQTLSPDYRQRQTSYVLQTLWRDLTSDVDIIGPHYTSDGTIQHKFLLPTLMDAVFKFHLCGFEVCAVVCDGASSNMTMVKELTGSERKAYGLKQDCEGKEKFSVKTWCLNPYTGGKIHFIICPSHQLKNMVSALFQSRTGGTRTFVKSGQQFGWKTIEDLHGREVKRIRCGQVTRVPKLKESHIVRDSWTRLNVLPSKVMQQDEVLSELLEYANTDPPPQDQQQVLATEQYLSALNKMFEKTLLGTKTKIFNPQGLAIQRLNEGFSYFEEWAEKLDSDGCFEDVVDCKSFISWQTWDLLRIMIYGFRGLVVDFLAAHPGYHINPRRINGSGIETLFGQLKHTTGGNLTGYSFETAKATLVTKDLLATSQLMTTEILPYISDKNH